AGADKANPGVSAGAPPSARSSFPATPCRRRYSPPGRGLLQYSERWPSYPAGPTPCRSVALRATAPSGRSQLPALVPPGAGAAAGCRALTEPPGWSHSAAPGAIEPSGYSELPAVFAPGAEAPTLFRAMTEPGSDHSAL